MLGKLLNMLTALIDADLVAFRVAATCDTDEDGALDIALLRCDKLMQDILEVTEASQYKAFLTGKNNFRKKINPDYKANRKDKIPPRYLQQCREFLINEWGAEVSEGCEADDLLGFNQTKDTILCSLDKDLDMIPGLHYNWYRGDIYEISEIEAIRHFYRQLLIGDRSDNIFGIDGIGKVKASKLIDHLQSEQDMYRIVKDLYNNDERLCMNMQCLWIWRNE